MYVGLIVGLKGPIGETDSVNGDCVDIVVGASV